MSTAVVIPPPNSSSVLRRVPRLTARARQLLTAVNLHFAGVAALIILNLFLIGHLIFSWQAVNASNQTAVAQQRTLLTTARLAARPLEGIDTRLADSTTQADAFYQHRLPYAFSQVLTELGTLTSRTGVRYSRGQYTETPVLSGPYALTEVRIDATIAGEYRSVIGFINAMERDKLFFNIRAITLSGQQTGQVNLRMRLITYLRAPGPGEAPGAPPANITAEPAPANGVGGQAQ